MKITEHAGHHNSFTEIKIDHVENIINTDVDEVCNYKGNVTLKRLVDALRGAGDALSTYDIPIKFNGKLAEGFGINLCRDKNHNYYIDFKI